MQDGKKKTGIAKGLAPSRKAFSRSIARLQRVPSGLFRAARRDEACTAEDKGAIERESKERAIDRSLSLLFFSPPSKTVVAQRSELLAAFSFLLASDPLCQPQRDTETRIYHRRMVDRKRHNALPKRTHHQRIDQDVIVSERQKVPGERGRRGGRGRRRRRAPLAELEEDGGGGDDREEEDVEGLHGC